MQEDEFGCDISDTVVSEPVKTTVTHGGRRFRAPAPPPAAAPSEEGTAPQHAPMAPPANAPAGGRPTERYNARLNRARSSNQMMQRSTSAASLREEKEVGQGGTAEEQVGNPGASIAPPSMGLRKMPPPMSWSKRVAEAMEAEVDRADCREMVRDITHAVLPTRKAMGGAEVVQRSRMSERSISEADEEQDFAAAPSAVTHNLRLQTGPRKRAPSSSLSWPLVKIFLALPCLALPCLACG